MNRLKKVLFTGLLVGLMMFLSITPALAQGDGNKLYENDGIFATVDRIEGDNRYLTSIEISKIGWDSADTVILARGNDFADALTSVPLYHKYGGPILLTPPNKLLDSTVEEMRRLGVSHVVIVGGEAAVSSKVEAEINQLGIGVTRIAGENRYETATLIADELSVKWSPVALVNGTNFPDALSVAPYVAVSGAPILLTKSNELPEETKEKIMELKPFTFVFGGTTAISENVWSQIPSMDKFRIGGENRFETNVMSARLGIVDEKQHAFVATGMDYADALTGAVLAAKQETGLLLVRPNNVPEVIADFIQDSEISSLTIFGGKNAVNQEVSRELERLLQ